MRLSWCGSCTQSTVLTCVLSRVAAHMHVLLLQGVASSSSARKGTLTSECELSLRQCVCCVLLLSCRPFDPTQATSDTGAWCWVGLPKSILLNGKGNYYNCEDVYKREVREYFRCASA